MRFPVSPQLSSRTHMHPAPGFLTRDPEVLLARFEAHPFATVVSVTDGSPALTHTPVIVESGELLFHVARSNRIAPALAGSGRALVSTLGAHAYVSPDWYGAPDQVGTWNYVSAEAEGPVRALDRDGTLDFLHALAATFDAEPPWTAARMTPPKMERLVAGITAYRLVPERLEGTTKLSQNKPPEMRERVIAALGDDPLAELMRAVS